MWPVREFSISVTRFGKISPILYAFGQNFIIVNGQILKKQSARLVKLFSILLRIGMQSV